MNTSADADDFWAGVGQVLSTYQVPLLILLVVVTTVVVTSLLTFLIRRTSATVLARAETRRAGRRRDQLAQAQLVRRTRTASTVAINVVIWAQVFIAAATILAILGVNLTAVLASAGVLAAVLTFGAQNLIKDVLAGFFMIFEDQLDVGDMVDTGLGAGVVETVGIRVTQVRDLTGNLISIRNGEISHVANGSRAWRRIVIDIAFAPDVDADTASRVVLAAMTSALALDAADDDILEPPQSAGIIAFSGDAFTLRHLTRLSSSSADRLDPQLRAAVREAVLREPGLTLATT